RNGSHCTPRGRHRIRAKIGAGEAVNTVFRGRRPTGEIYTPAVAAAAPQRDRILTRIPGLCGEQAAFNRFGEGDTRRGSVYLLGVADDARRGVPGSIGCIRMYSVDVLDLFERVVVGTPVFIHE